MLPTVVTLIADTSAAGGSALTSFLPLVLLGALMYFLIIRPQRKRQKEQQELMDSLRTGADVVTVGGLHGTVEELGEQWVDLAVDADGTVLRFQRQAIAKIVGAEDEAVDADATEDE